MSGSKKCKNCGAERSDRVCKKCGHEEKRGGRGRGGGKRKKEQPPIRIDARSTEGQKRAAEIIDALNKHFSKEDSYEIERFRRIDDAGVKESLDLRRWLYDKRDGKAMQEIRLANAREEKFEIVNVTSARDKLMARLCGDASGRLIP